MNLKIKKISIQDKNYPQLLKKIKDPPKILYFKGEIFPKEKCFAIVGTRKASDYGKKIAFEISQDLAKAGLTIVSGFAPGIDTQAHRGALFLKKRTIAVLGTGLDEKSIYPKENLKLAKEILKRGGALISEYPPGQKGKKYTFPKRNRIISGISLGVLVVEGQRKSGSLITASFAKKQKRKIFAIPGSIFSLNSKGPHFLIKKGAKLVESAQDILEELRINFLEKDFKKDFSLEEDLILKVLALSPLSLDKIIEKTKLAPEIVLSKITILETEGKIKKIGPNLFGICK